MLLASVEVMTGRVKEPTVTEQELYEAMWRRHSNRWPHKIVPAPLAIIVAMENAAAQEGASLRLLHPRQARKWLRLATDADRFFEAEPGNYPRPRISGTRHTRTYRNRWTKEGRMAGRGSRSRLSGRLPRTVPDSEANSGGLPARGKKRAFRAPAISRQWAFRAAATDGAVNGRRPILDWLRAGQALEHAILTELGSRHHPRMAWPRSTTHRTVTVSQDGTTF